MQVVLMKVIHEFQARIKKKVLIDSCNKIKITPIYD